MIRIVSIGQIAWQISIRMENVQQIKQTNGTAYQHTSQGSQIRSGGLMSLYGPLRRVKASGPHK